jgi:hypothetical protein
MAKLETEGLYVQLYAVWSPKLGPIGRGGIREGAVMGRTTPPPMGPYLK